MRVRYNCHVGKHSCTDRAEWRLRHGKDAERLSLYYHLACDYGTAVMISWENGGIAPIYLCESHATKLGRFGKKFESVPALTPQSVRGNHPTEDEGQTQPIEAAGTKPKRSVPSGSAADSQAGPGNKDLAVPGVPVPDLTSGDFAKASVNGAVEKVENIVREDFKAFGTALQGEEPSTATGEKKAESVNLERLCLSRYGQRCACEAAVHCPKCGRWFCDAHAEDEKWHACALVI